MQRHDANEATVIPVILRHCDWHYAPFGKLLGTPSDGRPVTNWPDRDEAFLQVAKEVRKVATLWQARASTVPSPKPQSVQLPSEAPPAALPAGPRSSNLRVAKTFTQLDKDEFLIESFEYLARFFQNSLAELQARNPGYQGAFRQIDANRFTATIYKDGKDLARATIYTGGHMGQGIYYSQGHSFSDGSFNESFSVEADDQSLYLRSLGMALYS